MSTTQFAPQLRPLSVGEQLDAAFKMVRQSFGTLALCVLVVALPLNIVSVLITASTRDNAFSYGSNAGNQSLDGTAIAGFLLTVVLGVVLTAIAAAACFRAVSGIYLGERPTVEGSLKFAASRVLAVIWLAILYGLGLILPSLLIIPGVWLAVAWSMSYPAMLAEGLGAARALGRSFRLVRGRWWPTFGALIVMQLIVFVISGIVTLLFDATLIAAVDNEPVAAVLTTISSTLSSMITLPLYAAMLTIIYYDLRVRKEGFDLHLLAQSVGGDAPTPENVAASSGLGGYEPSSGGGGFAPPQAPDFGHGGFAPPSAPTEPSSEGGLSSGDPLAPPPERREGES
jgi:uncharacterized membrane protein